jgi:hypothetical protein
MIMTYTGQMFLVTTLIFTSRVMRRKGTLSTSHSVAETARKESKKQSLCLHPTDFAGSLHLTQ